MSARSAQVPGRHAVMDSMNTNERNAEWAADRETLVGLQTTRMTDEDRAIYAALNRNADGTEGRIN